MDTNLFIIAFFVGFFGDLFLQLSGLDYGLKEYFKQHGKTESLFIAGGMMFLFYFIHNSLGLPFTYEYLILNGIIMDLIFRQFRIFPSLDGYYSNLNYFYTGFWQAFCMCLPLFINKIIKLL